ncbi:MAG TPA: NlpC/P60 family protein [Salinibacter sp.]|nr:NlpC/P60 family protein [Salinibacter sp.]
MTCSRSLVQGLRAAGLLVVLGGLTIGCGSSRSVSVDGTSKQPERTTSEVESKLRSAADEWDGVSQEWGGTTKEGVDCSGLVQSVYASKFNLSLPRTTDQQVRTGTRVSRTSLRPGDLVFFRHGRKKYHVGIYLSDGKFLHTSTSQGVTVSPLDQSYWNERWWQGRRLLALDGQSSPVASDTSQTASPGADVGW